MPSSPSRVEYVANTRIGEKGQLTIPKQYRDELGLETVLPWRFCELATLLSWSQSRIASGSSANPSHLFSSAMNSLPKICLRQHEIVFMLAAILRLRQRIDHDVVSRTHIMRWLHVAVPALRAAAARWAKCD